jgi:two-component system, response regulator YesN
MTEAGTYNILVVEDEKIIREGIAGSLREVREFSVQTAENGVRAMEILEKTAVHGIVLDIKMPRMDGLELLEWIRDRNLGATIFIVSGYDDFEYVQCALKAGADDYILKPATPEKMKEIAERFLARIREKEKVFYDWREMERRVEESKKLLKDRFFLELMEAAPDEQTWKEKTEYLKLNCRDLSEMVTAAVIELDGEELKQKYSRREQVYQVMIQKVEGIIGDTCGAAGADFFHPRSTVFVLLLPGNDLSAVVEEIRNSLESLLSLHVTAGIGNGYAGIQGIWESYQQAIHALQYKVVLGKHEVYRFSELRQEMHWVPADVDSGRFELAVQTGQADEAKRMINATIDLYRNPSRGGSLFPLYAECLKYISLLLGVLMDLREIPVNKSKGLHLGSPKLLVEKLFDQDTVGKVRDYLLKLTGETASLAVREKGQRHNTVVEGVKKIIHEGYTGELDNRKIAEELEMSPNYMGQVFKNGTGKSIKEYITFVRIEAAKKLLRNSRMMVYEIAFQTGFKDEHYFSSVFKTATGMSPSEYREL